MSPILIFADCEVLTTKQEEFLAKKGVFVPRDYCYIPGSGIYKLHKDVANWNNAGLICMREGGRLAILKSKQAADVLAQMFKNSNLTCDHSAISAVGVFLGFHDLFEEGNFQTILGQPLEKTGYSIWTEVWDRQPDNGGVFEGEEGSQNCGTLASDGGLDDGDCSWKLGFVCEIPMKKQ
ncbi:hypothetical protein QAD02_011839 [Eretmocerus hayati]|uniref:Uncharacterized protein n=1 Tax=Eretmocerus hayati TaxID=131215 RepID=A0ACC2NYX3_9HYME|nr:hypothetical protein QAD02_011839 [Eretmocerus hayati]